VWQETTRDERIGLIIRPPAEKQRWIVFFYGNGMTVAGPGLFDSGLAVQDTASPVSSTLASASVPGHLQNTAATAQRMRLLHTCSPPGHSRWLAAHIPHATAHFPAGQDHTNLEENNRSVAIAWVCSHM